MRLVKTIGDAAMFVSREPAPLVAAALTLVEAVEREPTSGLAPGIALGAALLRAGDYYGHAVNLASRVTGVARPGSVLCTEEVHDAAAEALRLVVRRPPPAQGRSSRRRCIGRARRTREPPSG